MNALNTFLENMNWGGLGDFLLSILAILFCITVHEASHGFAAYLLGDPTAKSRNRISLNPLRHIDPMGIIMMLLLGFGWAKPVPVNRGYFRRPRLGMAVTAAAGPASNFLLAYLVILLYMVLLPFYQLGITFLGGLCDFLVTVALMSIGLGIFNLIPIPPLDGFKVLDSMWGSEKETPPSFEMGIAVVGLVLLFVDKAQLVLTILRNAVFNGMVDGAVWLYYLICSLFV